MSGGADSTALILLALQARPYLPTLRLVVATVDHGLRSEAAAEAEWVAALCARLGLEHRTLRWSPKARRGNLAAAARDARYALLAQEAWRVGACAVVTAHHLDDQIETHVLAAERGGTGALLAGMRPVRALRPGLSLLRPFLDLPSARLRATLEAMAQAWLDDPSNRNTDYARVRARRALADGRLDRQGLLSALAAAQGLRRARDDALAGRMAGLVATDALAVTADGTIRIDADALAEDSAQSVQALLARSITAASGSAVPPAARAVAALPILRGAFAATLGGARLVRQGRTIVIHREYGRSGQFPIEPMGKAGLWFDRRFIVQDPARPGRLAALGTTGRGNAWARTLPVLIDAAGDVVAGHPALCRGKMLQLDITQTLGWRLAADLPGHPLRGLANTENSSGYVQFAPIAPLPVGKQMTDHYFDEDGQAVASGPVPSYGAAALIQDG